MSTKKKIAQATAIILGFSILGKILGFVREIIIAAIFGTTYKTDAYFIGFTGPDFIREIISGGVLTAVFIPGYTSHLSKSSPEDAKRLLNNLTTLLAVAMLLSVVIGIPLSPYLVRAIAPEIDPVTFGLSVHITKILFPAIIFMGLASFYGSLLNVHKHFATPSLAQIMLNLGIIGGVALLGRRYGVQSLAYGFVIGAILQFAILLPSLRARGISYKPTVSWSPELKKMAGLWLPLFFVSIFSVANDLVSRSLAAGLAPGNVAAITFANRIRETIWLICGVPLGTAIFPYLSDHVVNNLSAELEKLISFAIRLTAFMALPLCLLMLFYSSPIIRLLFERGMFDSNSTEITSQALLFYSVGALFYALNYVVLRVYYSMHDALTPLKAYGIALAVNIVSGIVLRNYLTIGGIALARSLSDLFVFMYLMHGISGAVATVKTRELFWDISKTGIISLLSVAVSFLLYVQLPGGSDVISLIFKLSFSFTCAAACYIGLGFMLKVREIGYLWDVFRRKLAL